MNLLDTNTVMDYESNEDIDYTNVNCVYTDIDQLETSRSLAANFDNLKLMLTELKQKKTLLQM